LHQPRPGLDRGQAPGVHLGLRPDPGYGPPGVVGALHPRHRQAPWPVAHPLLLGTRPEPPGAHPPGARQGMTDKTAIAKQVLAQRVLARRRLLYFTRLLYPNYTPGWVHHDICMRLERFSQAVADKKSPRLMLLVPPRHGK